MLCMPFRLIHAGSVFTELMLLVLDGLPYTAYMDDVSVASATAVDHLRHMRSVMARFAAFNLTLGTKPSWFCNSIDFLGYHITENGTLPQAAKVEALNAMKSPSSPSELRTWVGFILIYGRFIPHLAELTATMTELLSIGQTNAPPTSV